MAAFADMTLNDGQATPVAHSFKARRIDGIVAKYQDISGGISLGFPTVLISSREPVNGNDNYKVVVKVSLPVLETISGSSYAGVIAAPQLAYTLVHTEEWILPGRSTLPVRKDLMAYVKNLLATTVMATVIHDLDFVS